MEYCHDSGLVFFVHRGVWKFNADHGQILTVVEYHRRLPETRADLVAAIVGYCTFVFNLIVHQLIENNQFRTCYFTYTNATFEQNSSYPAINFDADELNIKHF